MTATVVSSFGARLAHLAATRPDGIALTTIANSSGGPDQHLTWRELDEASTHVALLLRERGASDASLVVVALPHGQWHAVAAYAAWKLGATVLPFNAHAPATERASVIGTAATFRPILLVGDPVEGYPESTTLEDLQRVGSSVAAPGRLPDRVARPGHVIASGGSTGKPKLINAGLPAEIELDLETDSPPAVMGLRPGQVRLICTPLHHTSGFAYLHRGLMSGDRIVLLERFEGSAFLDAVERYRVNHTILVPAIMSRLANRHDIGLRDLSSLEAVWHGGAVCPPWLKRRWIELVGPTCLWESFGGSEANGSTTIRGDEWLEHPGSVGRFVGADVRILDEEGRQLPSGEIGEIFCRPHGARGATFDYIGADRPRVTADGFTSLGDLGSLDEGGYLYIADRRVDMIITGGANVFAAEVESALSEHPAVADVVVLGVSDEQWGRRVHALVEPVDHEDVPSVTELDSWCRGRLSVYKVPKSYEFLAKLPRSDVGKVSRQRLTEARAAGWTQQMIRVKETMN